MKIKAGPEIDVLYKNGTHLGVLEIKQKLNIDDVKKYQNESLDKIRVLLDTLENHHGKTLIPMMAGKIVDDDARELAHEYGFIILRPNGGKIEVDDYYRG